MGWRDGMTDHQNDQRRLFPRGNGGGDRCIAVGDWLSIEHEGKTLVGMIYRCEGETYRFVYWDNRILRFATATRGQIGPWNEELTAQFRGQIAVIPNYVERCMAEWMMQPEERIKARLPMRWETTERELPKVQKRLFPD
jgi:hypothetical protein